MDVRKPDWLKINLPGGTECRTVKSVLSHHRLHTVCDEARCPNKEECWSNKTATFMVLGDICTRNCKFCNVHSSEEERRKGGEEEKRRSGEVEIWRGGATEIEALAQEPNNLAEAVSLLELQYVVITCVTRDDLPDGGAKHWANCIKAVRKKNPDCKIEVLISDHQGKMEDIQTILDAKPDVVAHNLETVKRLYPAARPQANYQRSLDVLKYIADAGFITKTGIMVGLGESAAEIEELMQDAKAHGVDIFTIGQYLQPTRKHLPVIEYVHPDTFADYKEIALKMGIKHVESGPLVRSSYKAKESYEKLQKRTTDYTDFADLKT